MGEKVGEDGREGWSRWWSRLEEMGEKVGVDGGEGWSRRGRRLE